MQPFTYIRESVVYAWNDSARIRRWAMILTCPCLCYCYCVYAVGSQDCTGRIRKRRQEQRILAMSEVKQARRERALVNRKRSISVNGRWTKNPFSRKRKTMEQSQSDFFGKLPAELRLKIYSMVFRDIENIDVDANVKAEDDMFKFSAGPGRSTGILRTCRRIYHGAVDMLYSEIDFTFPSYRRFILFTRSIPPPRLASIKRITIENTGLRWYSELTEEERHRHHYEYDDFFTAIASLPRLESLDLEFVAKTWLVYPYKRRDDIELLDEVEQRCNSDGAEVWYRIRASPIEAERLREWEYEKKKDRVSWTTWEIHPYQYTRLW